MPKVTAVIPCFNHGQFVDEAVDSLLAQTFKDLEVIIVNDGSTDVATVTKLKYYSKPRTSVLHRRNGHLGAARNHGIARAKSDYILTLDADDRFAPTFVAKAVAILEGGPKVGIVNCWAQLFGARSEVAKRQSGGDVRQFLTHNSNSASCLFRRRCWEEAGGYEESRPFHEDWDFSLAVTKRGWLVQTIREPLLFYRVAEGSMITGLETMKPDLMRKLVLKHRDLYAQHVDQVVYELELDIQQLGQKIETLRRSAEHRVGRALTQPGDTVRRLARRMASKK